MAFNIFNRLTVSKMFKIDKVIYFKKYFCKMYKIKSLIITEAGCGVKIHLMWKIYQIEKNPF